jgi:heptosyltransferase-3
MKMNPGEVVALRRGAMGDTLLFLPVLQALRARYPGAPLRFVGHGDYAGLARLAGVADRTHSVEGWPPVRWLHRGGGTGPAHPSLARVRAAVLEWTGPGVWGAARLFDPRPAPGAVEPLTRQLLRRLDLGDHLPWPPPRPAWPDLDLRVRGERVVLHRGAGSRIKMWPPDRWGALGKRLAARGLEVVHLAGPVEEERGLAGGCLVVRDALALARVLAGARGCVGHDSGPTHLAAALGVPTLALFGPTDPRVWVPPWESARTLRGGDTMADLALPVVAEAVQALVEG